MQSGSEPLTFSLDLHNGEKRSIRLLKIFDSRLDPRPMHLCERASKASCSKGRELRCGSQALCIGNGLE